MADLQGGPPPETFEEGCDVSHYEPTVDWTKVRASGRTWCYAKATQGFGYTDPVFAKHWDGMGLAGVARGAYHYGVPGLEARPQAELFFRAVGALRPDDLAPCLDLEEPTKKTGPDLVRWLCAFQDRAEALFNRPLLVYTGQSYWLDTVGDPLVPSLRGRRLWMARYGPEPPKPTRQWGPDGWTAWQYSEDAQVPGIGSCDVSKLRGGLAVLRAPRLA